MWKVGKSIIGQKTEVRFLSRMPGSLIWQLPEDGSWNMVKTCLLHKSIRKKMVRRIYWRDRLYRQPRNLFPIYWKNMMSFRNFTNCWKAPLSCQILFRQEAVLMHHLMLVQVRALHYLIHSIIRCMCRLTSLYKLYTMKVSCRLGMRWKQNRMRMKKRRRQSRLKNFSNITFRIIRYISGRGKLPRLNMRLPLMNSMELITLSHTVVWQWRVMTVIWQ